LRYIKDGGVPHFVAGAERAPGRPGACRPQRLAPALNAAGCRKEPKQGGDTGAPWTVSL
jgi:hypothetical protein